MTHIKQKDLRAFFDAIRDYNRAVDKYMRGSPSVEKSTAALKKAHTKLMSSLENPKLQKLVNDNIKAVQAEFKKLDGAETIITQLTDGTKQAELEKSLANNFGMSKKDVARLVTTYTPLEGGLQSFDVAYLGVCFEDMQKHLVSEMQEIRRLNKREKKSRKRDLLRGTFSTTFGAGIAAANTIIPPSFLFSYGVAAVALHQGARDFIGDPPN